MTEIDEQLNQLIELGVGSPEAAETLKRRVLVWMCPCVDGQPCGWPQCAQIGNGIGRFSMCARVALLKSMPDDLLRGLPEADVAVICAAVGKPVCVVAEHDASLATLPGTEEVEFFAEDGTIRTIWVRRDHLEEFAMDDEFKHEVVEVQPKLHVVEEPQEKFPPGWNIVDPLEVMQQHCVGCGKPVMGSRYAWRQRGPFWFEFAHVECAQDVD